MPVKIFFCYAHEDKAVLERLKMHLTPLQRDGLIEMWDDREIKAGTEWEQEIRRHLDEANVILLLISPDFMGSDFCYGVQAGRAMERYNSEEAIVIPIILGPNALWRGAPFGELQVLPRDGKPISQWPDLDTALQNVTKER